MAFETPEDRPRLLIVSHVLPFPGNAGQQQRVANTLRALRERFHVTFFHAALPGKEDAIRRRLLEKSGYSFRQVGQIV